MCLNCAALSSVISSKIAKFACNYLNTDMKHLTVVDPGEGPGGPAPPYYSAKMRPVGPKKNILENAPPPPPPPPYLGVWMTGPPTYLKVWIRHCVITVPIHLALCFMVLATRVTFQGSTLGVSWPIRFHVWSPGQVL